MRLILPVVLVSAAYAFDKYIVHDTFDGESEVAFITGFGEYECGGVVFEPDEEDYPFKPKSLDLLFGPDSVSETIVVQIYYPEGTTPDFGARVGEEAFNVTGSKEAFQRLDFEEAEIFLDDVTEGNVLVAVCFEENHASTPTIATDADGLDFRRNHYIYGDLGQGADWYTNEYVGGVFGDDFNDWIMRLCIETDNTDGTACPSLSDIGDADADADADTDTDTDADADTDTDADFFISTVVPSEAPFGESVDVVVLGGGFIDGTEARIGGINLVGLRVVDDASISGRSPSSLPSGLHDVEVVHPDGTTDYQAGAFEVTGGCGCGTSGGSGGLAVFGLAAVVIGLRRRR